MKTMDPKIELLRKLPGLAGYRDRQLARLAMFVDELELEPGEQLMWEGRPGSQAFVIVEGEASVTLRGKRLATLGVGEFVGEMALLDHSPRSATVEALTKLRVLVMDPASFRSLTEQPAVARRLAMSLAQRLRQIEGAPVYDGSQVRS